MMHIRLFRKFLLIMTLAALMGSLASCRRYEPKALEPGAETAAAAETLMAETEEESSEQETLAEETETEEADPEEEPDTRIPTKVKGIYLASKPLASEDFMASLWDNLDQTELNAVVIDIKDDYGRITYDMQGSALVDSLGAEEAVIEDLPGLMEKFRQHGIYTIARIVSMRDPYIGEAKPEWCLTRRDGTIYKDNSGYTWINPYKRDYWEYLLEIGKQCAADGFDEVQFDYFRFCTDKGADDCILDETETEGEDKVSIITEAAQYLGENLKKEGVFVSLDVFGTIIGSQLDSRSVGQNYAELAANVDYMCPMIYPSHYSAGNFGLDMPDKHPYDSILGALKMSRKELQRAQTEPEEHQAQVRPWLQAFTATWLGSGNYISYGAEELRAEIQAVYDAGYDEWIFWSASVSYAYDSFLSPEAAADEEKEIAESRAAKALEETEEELTETFPQELQDALDGDDLSDEDKEILEQDGPIVTYE